MQFCPAGSALFFETFDRIHFTTTSDDSVSPLQRQRWIDRAPDHKRVTALPAARPTGVPETFGAAFAMIPCFPFFTELPRGASGAPGAMARPSRVPHEPWRLHLGRLEEPPQPGPRADAVGHGGPSARSASAWCARQAAPRWPGGASRRPERSSPAIRDGRRATGLLRRAHSFSSEAVGGNLFREPSEPRTQITNPPWFDNLADGPGHRRTTEIFIAADRRLRDAGRRFRENATDLWRRRRPRRACRRGRRGAPRSPGR